MLGTDLERFYNGFTTVLEGGRVSNLDESVSVFHRIYVIIRHFNPMKTCGNLAFVFLLQ